MRSPSAANRAFEPLVGGVLDENVSLQVVLVVEHATTVWTAVAVRFTCLHRAEKDTKIKFHLSTQKCPF